MWEADVPDADDALRQGDLLIAVRLPRLDLPFDVAHAQGRQPANDAVIAARSFERDFIVVSQCCEIENGDHVAVAPIKSTAPLDDMVRAALDAEQPPDEDKEGNYVFDQLKLGPLEGLVHGWDDRYSVANLGMIMSLGGERRELHSYRRGRMTPEGRRLLRIKLSFFYGRVEAEDAAYLDAHGIPAGPYPPA